MTNGLGNELTNGLASGDLLGNPAWAAYLFALLLLVVRVGGWMVFLPVFSTDAIPARVKVGFTLALTAVLAPVAAAAPAARLAFGLAPVLGELGIGMLLGLCLRLIQEMVDMAGHLLNFEFSFSLVNVLDPGSHQETPLMSQMLNLFFLLLVFASGLHRTMIAALLRTLEVVPLGQAWIGAQTGPALATMFAGVLLGGMQLAAPVIAAAFLIEIAVALVGRLAPQLPVLIVGIPLKTLTGYLVLLASIGLWPRYIDAHFASLLDHAFRLLHQETRV